MCSILLKEKYATFYDKLGIFVHTKCPWFGFSPDGILVRNNRKILVEIKTPDVGQTCDCLKPNCRRNCSSATFTEKNISCLTRKGENLELKKKHSYYAQIQLGLYLLGLQTGILVLYSEFGNDFREFVVPYDSVFCKDFVPTLSELYFTKFLPFLEGKKGTKLQKFASLMNIAL